MAEGVLPAIRLRPRLHRLRVVAPVVLQSRVTIVLFFVVPSTAFYAACAFLAVRGLKSGSDFASFWEGGRHALRGLSPYPAIDTLPAVADRLTFVPFVYPAPAAFAMAPLSILPFPVADTLFFLIAVTAVLLALRALDVRDWRCHAVALTTLPAMAAVSIGTLSTLLLLGVALAWRYRNTTWRVAAVVAALVVAKLFLWPLWLWLVYTRRFAAAAVSALAAAAVTLAAWAVIGFAGLHDYPTLLSRLTELVGTNSFSAYALGRTEGLSGAAAQAVVFGAAAVLAAWVAWRFPSARRQDGAFVVALGLALLLTPILWPHYAVLTLVPIALVRKRLSAPWLLPMLFWFDGAGWSYGDPWQIAPFLCIAALPFAFALRSTS